jgi:hypothetical protein
MLDRTTSHPRRIMSTKRIIIGALLSGGIALAGLGLSMGTAYAFDPQPDPPGGSASSPRLNPGVIRGFDPQPEPPVRIASPVAIPNYTAK